MDFKTVLLEDSRISDVRSEITYGVESGPQDYTVQQLSADSISSSNVQYNIQVANKGVLIDRNLKIQNILSVTLDISGVPTGAQAFSYGFTDSFQAFPFMKSINTVQTSINNCNISTNLKDIIDVVLKQNDIRELNRYNSSCPSYPDSQIGQYSYTAAAGPTSQGGTFSIAGSSVNPMGSISGGSLDYDFAPRGAFPLTFCQVDRYIGTTYQDDSPISTGTANENWKVSLQIQTQEPVGLALGPWINTNPFDCAGMSGINNMTFTFNLDSKLARVFSTSNYTVSGGVKTAWITNISGGISPYNNTAYNQPNFVSNSTILLNQMSLQPSQVLKQPKIQSIPYIDYSSVIVNPANNNQPIQSGATAQIVSSSTNFSLIADKYIVYVRKQMATQNWSDPASFLAVQQASLQFNLKSGLLSSLSQQDLWMASVRAGSQQSWLEFQGQVSQNNNQTGCAFNVPSLGSILVLSPAELFGLNEELAPGSLGQFQFSINLTVKNQYSYAITPEIVILPIQSGVIQISDGLTQAYTGILSGSKVIETKERGESDALDKSAYMRLVGGKSLHHRALSGLHKIADHIKPHLKHIGHKLHGGVTSGAGMQGGVMSAAGMKKRVSKYC